jgi:putative transposase
MIDRAHPLSITRQAKALGISRGAVYYVPRPLGDHDLALMRALDARHLDFPFAGARMLRRLLRGEFPGVGRRRIGTLMLHMGIAAICPQPGTSRRHRAHPVYPYLLRHTTITRPNHVWAMDITYIPMAHGFVYLAAVLDWASRRVLSWRVSITLDSAFGVAAVEEAFATHGCPEIFNTDQGAQFTSADFTGLLLSHRIRISMDSKGCWRDTSSSNGSGARSSMRRCTCTPTTPCPPPPRGWAVISPLYNTRRPHSSLDDRTPDEAYFTPTPLAIVA